MQSAAASLSLLLSALSSCVVTLLLSRPRFSSTRKNLPRMMCHRAGDSNFAKGYCQGCHDGRVQQHSRDMPLTAADGIKRPALMLRTHHAIRPAVYKPWTAAHSTAPQAEGCWWPPYRTAQGMQATCGVLHNGCDSLTLATVAHSSVAPSASCCQSLTEPDHQEGAPHPLPLLQLVAAPLLYFLLLCLLQLLCWRCAGWVP